jgi:glutamate synthase domain-containing protein 3
MFDTFGWSVATSADGKTIIVGAASDEIGATTSTGVVYVFDRVGNSFNQVGILTGSLAVDASDSFGYSVATSADGKTIIVGANNDEIGATTGSGVVYVFDRVGNSFNQVGILTGSLAVDANDNFGISVATSADGKTIVVGAYPMKLEQQQELVLFMFMTV